jgi:hypothetical protein
MTARSERASDLNPTQPDVETGDELLELTTDELPYIGGGMLDKAPPCLPF